MHCIEVKVDLITIHLVFPVLLKAMSMVLPSISNGKLVPVKVIVSSPKTFKFDYGDTIVTDPITFSAVTDSGTRPCDEVMIGFHSPIVGSLSNVHSIYVDVFELITHV